MRAHDLAKRFEQETLPGQRMQSLDVHEHVPLAQAEGGAGLHLLALVVEHELGGDRRIDHAGLVSRQSELDRARLQPVAVEGDMRRVLVGPREQIGTEPPGPVVPDLGAVQRHHDRLSSAVREKRGDLGQQAVAMDVHDIGGQRSPAVRDARSPDTS